MLCLIFTSSWTSSNSWTFLRCSLIILPWGGREGSLIWKDEKLSIIKRKELGRVSYFKIKRREMSTIQKKKRLWKGLHFKRHSQHWRLRQTKSVMFIVLNCLLPFKVIVGKHFYKQFSVYQHSSIGGPREVVKLRLSHRRRLLFPSFEGEKSSSCRYYTGCVNTGMFNWLFVYDPT